MLFRRKTCLHLSIPDFLTAKSLRRKKMKKITLLAVLLTSLNPSFGQNITAFKLDKPNFVTITGIQTGKTVTPVPYGLPLISVLIDSNFYTSYCTKPEFKGDEITQVLADSIRVIYKQQKKFSARYKISDPVREPGQRRTPH